MPEQAPADPRASEHFDNPLTVIDAETRFRDAGLPRHPKSIERYCRSGSLRCKKEYGANGLQYLIDPKSADELIEFLKQAHQIRNMRAPAPAGSGSLQSIEQGKSDEQGSDLLPPAPARSDSLEDKVAAEQAGTDADRLRYVQQLEKRLDEKDGEIGFLRSEVAVKNDQIKDLTERARETNHLIAGLQRMLSPLLGTSEQRQGRETDDAATDHSA
jgi:hypothetical protein